MRMTGARDAVVSARKAKPWWSLQDISRQVGVSRERVRQILVEEGLPTRRYMPKDLIDQAMRELQARKGVPTPPDTVTLAAGGAISASPLHGSSMMDKVSSDDGN